MHIFSKNCDECLIDFINATDYCAKVNINCYLILNISAKRVIIIE